MKLICEGCELAMGYQGCQPLSEGRLAIRFTCERCARAVSMVTNAGESMLVQSLGVRLRGAPAEPAPLELTRQTLAPSEGAPLQWDDAAQRRIDRVPALVRHMARQTIEAFARQQGLQRITEGLLDEYRARGGPHQAR